MTDKKMYNTWMTVTILVMAVIGLAFILVSILDEHADTWVLMVGLLFVAGGTLFNVIRLQQNKKNQE